MGAAQNRNQDGVISLLCKNDWSWVVVNMSYRQEEWKQMFDCFNHLTSDGTLPWMTSQVSLAQCFKCFIWMLCKYLASSSMSSGCLHQECMAFGTATHRPNNRKCSDRIKSLISRVHGCMSFIAIVLTVLTSITQVVGCTNGHWTVNTTIIVYLPFTTTGPKWQQ